MKRTIKAALGGLPLVVLASVASAEQPVQLTDQQMDGVTAAGSAFADAEADAFGGGFAFTFTEAEAKVAVVSSFSSQATTINLVASDAKAFSFSEAD